MNITARESMFMFWVITKHKEYISLMTMKATTDGEVASIRVRLEQATWLTSPLAQQAGGANIADITYNTYSITTHYTILSDLTIPFLPNGTWSSTCLSNISSLSRGRREGRVGWSDSSSKVLASNMELWLNVPSIIYLESKRIKHWTVSPALS